MYHAADGANTHKGVIYTLGIVCESIGRHWRAYASVYDIDSILSESGNIAHPTVEADFAADGSTAGQKLYLKYGLGGIRAKVAEG